MLYRHGISNENKGWRVARRDFTFNLGPRALTPKRMNWTSLTALANENDVIDHVHPQFCFNRGFRITAFFLFGNASAAGCELDECGAASAQYH